MAINIYDNANEMAETLKQTPQFLGVQNAYAQLKTDALAFGLFKQFQDKQMELQKKQMNGQELSDEEMKTANDLGEKISKIAPITNLMAQEQQMSQLIDELNQIIMKPIMDVYQDK